MMSISELDYLQDQLVDWNGHKRYRIESWQVAVEKTTYMDLGREAIEAGWSGTIPIDYRNSGDVVIMPLEVVTEWLNLLRLKLSLVAASIIISDKTIDVSKHGTSVGKESIAHVK